MTGTGGSVQAYIHLPGRHEVCALPDPLKDPLQLGVDEGVVWEKKKKKREVVRKKAIFIVS